MSEIKLTIHIHPMEEKHAESGGACGGNDCDCGGDCADASAGVGVLRQKSPEEMSVEELIEALNATCYLGDKCKKILGVDWCKGFDNCHFCRKHLLDLLKAAHEREMENAHKREEMQVDALEAITREVAEKQRQIDDLTHECDGLQNRLAELDSAGITELHRLLRETIGDAKNVTDTARIYVEKTRERRKPDSERKAVIERLRKIDQGNVPLYKIGCAVLGYVPTPWWEKENSAELRDKLIDLIGEGDAE